jgi:EAL domain
MAYSFLAADLGVRMAIDDFGTGFSSLGRLRDLPVDYLKIDQSFVTDALTDRQNAAIVESVVDLAHRLGRQVVAEGVEDAATLAYLDRLGVDYAQGFHIGRPVPPSEINSRLQAEARVWSTKCRCRPSTCRPANARKGARDHLDLRAWSSTAGALGGWTSGPSVDTMTRSWCARLQGRFRVPTS